MAGKNDNAVTIEAGVLAKAMKHAAAVVERRNTIPILSNVRLTAEGDTLEIVTTDLDVEFRQRLPLKTGGPSTGSGLATTVDASRLSQLVSVAESGAQVSLAVENNRLLVKSGRSRWQLPVLPVDDFPIIVFDPVKAVQVTMPGANLAEWLARVVWSVSTEQHRHYLHGPLLHGEGGKVALASTNGHTLMRVVGDADLPAGAADTILSPKFCRIVQALAADSKETATLSWDGSKSAFELGAASVVGKAINGTFPDYRRVIPGESRRVVFDPDSLRAAVRRVSVVETAKTRAFKMEHGDGKLTLSVTSPEGGTACEEVPADAEAGQECGFNARYFEQMLDAIGGESVEIHQQDAGSPALFRRLPADGATGVVMPMRM